MIIVAGLTPDMVEYEVVTDSVFGPVEEPADSPPSIIREVDFAWKTDSTAV